MASHAYSNACIWQHMHMATHAYGNNMHIATHASGESPGFGRGQELFFFQIWKFACREAMRIARGVRGHAPPRKFF